MESKKTLSIEECVNSIDEYLKGNTMNLPFVAVDVNLLKQVRSYLLDYKLARLQNEANTTTDKQVPLIRKTNKATVVRMLTSDDLIDIINKVIDSRQ